MQNLKRAVGSAQCCSFVQMHSDLGFRNLLLTLVIIFLAKYQVTSEWEHSKAVVLYSQSRSSGNNSTPDAALEVFF